MKVINAAIYNGLLSKVWKQFVDHKACSVKTFWDWEKILQPGLNILWENMVSYLSFYEYKTFSANMRNIFCKYHLPHDAILISDK